MRGEGARRADEGLSLEAAKTAKDPPPTERWACFGGGFLAVCAARNDTLIVVKSRRPDLSRRLFRRLAARTARFDQRFVRDGDVLRHLRACAGEVDLHAFISVDALDLIGAGVDDDVVVDARREDREFSVRLPFDAPGHFKEWCAPLARLPSPQKRAGGAHHSKQSPRVP